VFPHEGCDFVIGKGIKLRDGEDATIIANGLLVSRALQAADLPSQEDVSTRVLDLHTVKSLDVESIRGAAADTGAIVATEDHLLRGISSRAPPIRGHTEPACAFRKAK
jgi:transketolase